MTFLDAFKAFISCFAAGEHDFTKSTTCSRCGAVKGGPSILSLVQDYALQKTKPLPLCHACWEASGKPSAALYADQEAEPVCIRCRTATPKKDIVWVMR